MVNYISNIKRIDLKEKPSVLEGCYYCWAASSIFNAVVSK